MPSQADQYCANISVNVEDSEASEEVASIIVDEWQRRLDAARSTKNSITQIDAWELDVLTEWCRNKPEKAAAEILAMRARDESESSSGGYCQCGRWIPEHVS